MARPQDLRGRTREPWRNRAAFLRLATYAGRTMAARRGKSRSQTVPKNERRLQILAAAREVFAKRGYHQTTIDDIVMSAGVARGTFYLYFEDKRAVFSDLIDRFAGKLSMAIDRIVTDDPTRPVANQVQENIRSIIRACLSERTMTKILFTGAVGVDPEFDRKIATFYDTVVQLLTESLRDGQALGIVADGEPRVLAYLSIGAFKELLYQAVILGLSEESAEVLLQQMYNFLRQGYLRVSELMEPAKHARPRRKN